MKPVQCLLLQSMINLCHLTTRKIFDKLEDTVFIITGDTTSITQRRRKYKP